MLARDAFGAGGARPLARSREAGATTAEMVVMLPTALLVLMLLAQTAIVFHAKNLANLAAVQAARAGSLSYAEVGAIREGFARALVPLMGGGTTTGELAAAYARALPEAAQASIEIISPTRQAFDDYDSPVERTRLEAEGKQVDEPVIQNMSIAGRRCPYGNDGCNADPSSNASGQTLQEANNLKLRIVWGLPASKQVPLIGPLMVQALSSLNNLGVITLPAATVAMLQEGRIPIVVSAAARMQTEPIRNDAMVDTQRNPDITTAATGTYAALTTPQTQAGTAAGANADTDATGSTVDNSGPAANDSTPAPAPEPAAMPPQPNLSGGNSSGGSTNAGGSSTGGGSGSTSSGGTSSGGSTSGGSTGGSTGGCSCASGSSSSGSGSSILTPDDNAGATCPVTTSTCQCG